ncbi:glycolate oxidase subunit GlcE [Methylohalobius crimeensis]|uniref:glycolate oxidase subunit GlcE n=1 Tax=Methylohalobius crimeensis TaxID=244365 RepID=UPI0003B6AF25|nr:glycolate oxidase subunit GlcE [Methylohalobius crimeensis]
MDRTSELKETIEAAIASRRPLCIVGGGSKNFYGRRSQGDPLSIAGHRGVVEYAPSELVITARAGTPLADLEQALAAEGQMLPFEPPRFGPATVGGAIAAGLSGPRRPFTGAVRDFVLGVKLLTGRGEVLSFGGQVMKNVAGFDLSRLLAGSLGTLGVILEVSLKVLPRPAVELTLSREVAIDRALDTMADWMGQSLPLSALAYEEPLLYVRLSGTERAVASAADRLGGERLAEGERFWESLREQQRPFFTEGNADLWRLSLPPAAPAPDLPGRMLLDWAGAQRWLRSLEDAQKIFRAAADLGGHATLFRSRGARHEVFQPLPESLAKLHRALKEAFDPHRILNPGRMYAEL